MVSFVCLFVFIGNSFCVFLWAHCAPAFSLRIMRYRNPLYHYYYYYHYSFGMSTSMSLVCLLFRWFFCRPFEHQEWQYPKTTWTACQRWPEGGSHVLHSKYHKLQDDETQPYLHWPRPREALWKVGWKCIRYAYCFVVVADVVVLLLLSSSLLSLCSSINRSPVEPYGASGPSCS